MATNTPPTPPIPPTGNTVQPEITYTRDQLRTVIKSWVRQNQPNPQQLIDYVESLNNKWGLIEMKMLVMSKTIKANVKAKPRNADGTPQAPDVKYFVE